MNVTVIICSHNPNPDYLNQTLHGLRNQTLPFSKWELLLVDNASNKTLAERVDLSWHPSGRHIREEELGLTPARLRGIREASSDLLIFVDDDNILATDYLEKAVDIGVKHPFLGAWGGSMTARYEKSPDPWVFKYVSYLAIREVKHDAWSNLVNDWTTTPAGAGMVVRRVVALKYAQEIRNDPIRLSFGRKGASLSSSEDTDMAFLACDMGLGTGQFTALRLDHLIPAGRVTLEYLERLAEGITFSTTVLFACRGQLPPVPVKPTLRTRIREWRLLRSVSEPERRMRLAQQRGEQKAIALLRESGLMAVEPVPNQDGKKKSKHA